MNNLNNDDGQIVTISGRMASKMITSTASNYLGIGDMVFGTGPNTITTVLGSCVAITMYDPSQQIGAICHSALPKCTAAHKCHSGCGKAGKHVECAVRVMLQQFSDQHIPKEKIQVKIFGGANMFSQVDQKDPCCLIGAQNEETARRVISQEGLTIEAEDTGGQCGRRIIFDISTGKVRVQKPKKFI